MRLDMQPTRIEELSVQIAELRQLAEKLNDLEPTARRIGIWFANDPEAAGLEKRLENEVGEAYSEAGRLDEILAREPVTSQKDALLLLLNTSWRLANADEESCHVVENVFKNLIAFFERESGLSAEELGFDPITALRSSREVLLGKIATFERLTNKAEAEFEEQTKEDLRNRLAALFRAVEDGKKSLRDESAAHLLGLRGDNPYLVAAKLIITNMDRLAKNDDPHVRAQNDVTLSALRMFGLEDFYHRCMEGIGEEDAA
jgi:hypothetical protein